MFLTLKSFADPARGGALLSGGGLPSPPGLTAGVLIAPVGAGAPRCRAALRSRRRRNRRVAQRPSGRGAARARRRHFRGAGAHLAGHGRHHAGAPARHRRARNARALRRRAGEGAGRARRAGRGCWRKARSAFRVSARTNMAAASMPMSRPRARPMCRRPCSTAVTRAAIPAASGRAGAAESTNGISTAARYDLGADRRAAIKIHDVGVVHADAAMRDEAADRGRIIGAVDGVIAVVEAHAPRRPSDCAGRRGSRREWSVGLARYLGRAPGRMQNSSCDAGAPCQAMPARPTPTG